MLVIHGFDKFIYTCLEIRRKVPPTSSHILIEQSIDSRKDDLCEKFNCRWAFLRGISWFKDSFLWGKVQVQLRDKWGQLVNQENLCFCTSCDCWICKRLRNVSSLIYYRYFLDQIFSILLGLIIGRSEVWWNRTKNLWNLLSWDALMYFWQNIIEYLSFNQIHWCSLTCWMLVLSRHR